MDSFGLLLISMIDMIFLGAVLRSPTWDECPIYQTSIIVCLPDINLFFFGVYAHYFVPYGSTRHKIEDWP